MSRRIQEIEQEEYVWDQRDCHYCGSDPGQHVVINFDRMWGDGDVYCRDCGEYVRMYNSG